MQIICKKCGRKMIPILHNHIYNGSESIMHGHENVKNGRELIRDGHEKIIYNFQCPFCGTKHKQGTTIHE